MGDVVDIRTGSIRALMKATGLDLEKATKLADALDAIERGEVMDPVDLARRCSWTEAPWKLLALLWAMGIRL